MSDGSVTAEAPPTKVNLASEAHPDLLLDQSVDADLGNLTAFDLRPHDLLKWK